MTDDPAAEPPAPDSPQGTGPEHHAEHRAEHRAENRAEHRAERKAEQLSGAGHGPDAPAGRSPAPRGRLASVLRPRLSRGQLLAALLCGVLGFALVVQVRQTQTGGLSSLRQSELVGLLDTVSERAARLDAEARQLQDSNERLRSGADRSAAAEQAAQARLEELSILAGTAPAAGPGIELDITDPQHQVNAAILLDTLQELRDAGAEAVQIGSGSTQVRVVASTSFVDDPRGVRVDGQVLEPPYQYRAIGDPPTLSAALGIPGGVLEVLREHQASGQVSSSANLLVSALRPVPTAQYARPAPAAS